MIVELNLLSTETPLRWNVDVKKNSAKLEYSFVNEDQKDSMIKELEEKGIRGISKDNNTLVIGDYKKFCEDNNVNPMKEKSAKRKSGRFFSMLSKMRKQPSMPSATTFVAEQQQTLDRTKSAPTESAKSAESTIDFNSYFIKLVIKDSVVWRETGTFIKDIEKSDQVYLKKLQSRMMISTGDMLGIKRSESIAKQNTSKKKFIINLQNFTDTFMDQVRQKFPEEERTAFDAIVLQFILDMSSSYSNFSPPLFEAIANPELKANTEKFEQFLTELNLVEEYNRQRTELKKSREEMLNTFKKVNNELQRLSTDTHSGYEKLSTLIAPLVGINARVSACKVKVDEIHDMLAEKRDNLFFNNLERKSKNFEENTELDRNISNNSEYFIKKDTDLYKTLTKKVNNKSTVEEVATIIFDFLTAPSPTPTPSTSPTPNPRMG